MFKNNLPLRKGRADILEDVFEVYGRRETMTEFLWVDMTVVRVERNNAHQIGPVTVLKSIIVVKPM